MVISQLLVEYNRKSISEPIALIDKASLKNSRLFERKLMIFANLFMAPPWYVLLTESEYSPNILNLDRPTDFRVIIENDLFFHPWAIDRLLLELSSFFVSETELKKLRKIFHNADFLQKMLFNHFWSQLIVQWRIFEFKLALYITNILIKLFLIQHHTCRPK